MCESVHVRACAVFTNIKLFVLCVYSCTAVDIVGLVVVVGGGGGISVNFHRDEDET